MESITGKRAGYVQGVVAHHYVVPTEQPDVWRCHCDETLRQARCHVEHHVTVQIIHVLNVLDGKPSHPDTLAKAWGLDKERI
jgi:hypothetical protein